MLEQLLVNQPWHPLRALREAANVSQAQLAKATGLSCTRISLIENCLGQPLSGAEEKQLKDAIVAIIEGRRRAVLSEVSR